MHQTSPKETILHQIPTLEQPISRFKLSFSALSDQKIKRSICQSLAEIHSWHLAVELSQLTKIHPGSGGKKKDDNLRN